VAGEPEVVDARRDLTRVRLAIAVGVAEGDVGEGMDHHLLDRLTVRGIDGPGLLDDIRVGGLPRMEVDVEIEMFDRSAQDVAPAREVDLVVERVRPVDVETGGSVGELSDRRFRTGDRADQLRREAFGKCRRSGEGGLELESHDSGLAVCGMDSDKRESDEGQQKNQEATSDVYEFYHETPFVRLPLYNSRCRFAFQRPE